MIFKPSFQQLKRSVLTTFTSALAVLAMVSVNPANMAWSQEANVGVFRVVGYLPEYRFAEFNPSNLRHLTDLILFSAQPAEDGSIDLSSVLKNDSWREWRTAENKQVRFQLCIGGWERSKNFATVARSKEKRARFVAEAVSVCQKYELSGIDLDWEHPADIMQQNDYAALIKDLKVGLVPHRLTVSVTIAAWQHLSRQAYLDADAVNIMAYDHEGKHSTLEGALKDVQLVRGQGADVSKVVLGLPFYGRSIAKSADTLTYRQIVEKFHPNPSIDEVDGVYFNGRKTIETKTNWAKSKGLAGVMIWEIGQDASGDDSLLKAVHDTAKKIAVRRAN